MIEKLRTTEDYVLAVLKRNKRARKDDFILYGGVLKEMGISLKLTLAEFLANAKQDNVPSFETVTRCRRHIQEQMPELKDENITLIRQETVYDFVEYNNKRVGY